MKAVWKFPLPIDDVIEIEMPRGAEILHVSSQADSPMLWALVEQGAAMEKRRFRFAGTGHLIEEPELPECLKHRGSWSQNNGKLIFHLFEYVRSQ